MDKCYLYIQKRSPKQTIYVSDKVIIGVWIESSKLVWESDISSGDETMTDSIDDEETDVSKSQKETAVNSENSETSFENRAIQKKISRLSIITLGCSGSMTGDKDKLSDLKILKVLLAFGNDSKGGRISGKGTIKTSCLDFEKVSYERTAGKEVSISSERQTLHESLYDFDSSRISSPSSFDDQRNAFEGGKEENTYDMEKKYTEEGGAADYNKMDPTIDVTSTPTLRIHKIHPQSQIIGKSTDGVLTRRKLKEELLTNNQVLAVFIYKQNDSQALAYEIGDRNARRTTSIQATRCMGLILGACMYLKASRPDIKFAVSVCTISSHSKVSHLHGCQNDSSPTVKVLDPFLLHVLSPKEYLIEQFGTTSPLPSMIGQRIRSSIFPLMIMNGMLGHIPKGLHPASMPCFRVVTALARRKNHILGPHSKAASSQGITKVTPTQSAAQASISQSTLTFKGSLGGSRTTLFSAKQIHTHSRPTQETVQIRTAGKKGTLSEEHYVQEEDTADPFFDDIVDKDAAVTPDIDRKSNETEVLERKSDETEEINIEEKEVSNVKSGDTEELDLETTQSTARQSTITLRTLKFEMQHVLQPTLSPFKLWSLKNNLKLLEDSCLLFLDQRGLSIPSVKLQNDEEVARKSQLKGCRRRKKKVLKIKKSKAKVITVEEVGTWMEVEDDNETAIT
ncbi:hypothetical protein Tco_0405502 [Tanacetum coccineum]